MAARAGHRNDHLSPAQRHQRRHLPPVRRRRRHHIGEPTDPSESERIEWLPIDELRTEIVAGRVLDGLSLTALLWWLTFRDA